MLRKRDMLVRDPDPKLPFASDAGRDMPVTALGIDYEAREEVRPHRHDVCQLIYAIRGVMVVSSSAGQWIVPATRAVWMPAHIEHSIRMVGQVGMRRARGRLPQPDRFFDYVSAPIRVQS